MRRVFKITLGLILIGYGVYSGNAWFYLGVIPIAFGLINWCPMEKLFGKKCEEGSCDCSSKKDKEPTVKWSTQKSEDSCCSASGTNDTKCCSDNDSKSKNESCCSSDKEEPCCTDSECIKIEVLGTGCAKCKTLEASAIEAISKVEGSFCVEKVEDIQKIMAYNVMSTPALVIDGKVVSSGKLLSAEEIAEILKAH